MFSSVALALEIYSPSMKITGVIDGPLPGGLPKAIELFVIKDIDDLSGFGVGAANNGGGSDGQEFTFPADSAKAGDYIYLSHESDGFAEFFAFKPTYVGYRAAQINGDDAIELFEDNEVIDVFGEINADGTGQPWEYENGWASRIAGSEPNAGVFDSTNWAFSGKNALDGITLNYLNPTFSEVRFPINTIPTQISYTDNPLRNSLTWVSWNVLINGEATNIDESDFKITGLDDTENSIFIDRTYDPQNDFTIVHLTVHTSEVDPKGAVSLSFREDSDIKVNSTQTHIANKPVALRHDYFIIGDGELNYRQPSGATVLTSPEFTLSHNKWLMFSLPLDPGSQNTVQDIFDELDVSKYNRQWQVWDIDNSTNTSSVLDLTSPLELGKAYWIISLLPETTITMDGTAALLFPEITEYLSFTESLAYASTSQGYFNVSLQSNPNDLNNNAIGYPHHTSANWAEHFRVFKDLAYLTTAEAAEKELMLNVFYKGPSGSGQSGEYSYTPAAGDILPWEAFWVQAPELKEDTTLAIPRRSDGTVFQEAG
jgi:hypothetical protein